MLSAMSPRAGTSSLALHATVGRRDNRPRTITHSQKGLQHLTKVAVDRAYKLHAESRRLVHIVETQSCGGGDSTSHPFSSLSSTLLKTSSSKNWALSKDSRDRRSVAARIHTLLNQWRADASSEWRSRVASVVPVLEEVLYKEAKSQEEYTNPNLLESQLMNVLRHFEAGNGPFLLQGSSPLYPVRACGPASSSSKGTSPIYQHVSGQAGTNGDSHEIASEEVQPERVTLTCTQSPVSACSPLSTRAVPNGSEFNDTVQRICDAKVSTDKRGRSRTSRRIVKKVVAMLLKRRKEKKQGLGRDNQGAELVESFSFQAVDRVEANNNSATCDQSLANSCRGKERMRSTLGGIFKLDMFSMKSSSAISAEAADLLSSSTNNETAHNGVRKSGAEASSYQACIADSQLTDAGRLSYVHSSIASTPSPRTSSASASAPSAPMPGILMSCSPSSPAQSSSASTPSPSRLVRPHRAPFVLPVQSSSSPTQDHFTRTSVASLKPMSQHQSSSSSPQLACLSASSDVPSVELNYARPRMCRVQQNGALSDNGRANALLRACRGKEQATQTFAFQQSMTQIAFEEPREIGQKGESSSTFSTRSSPSASHEEAPKTSLEKKVKLPLRSFLAEREEYKGCKSSYVAGGPWDTWEEATERLDGMCCVCMVGLKGAAFIPCGHTFCRRCSRELWRGRGTCPLCNRYIREILDIY